MRFLYNEVLDIFSPLVFLIAGFIVTVGFSSSLNEVSTGNGAFLGLGISVISICMILVIKLVKYIMKRFFNVTDFSFMNIIVPLIVLLIALYNAQKINLLFEDRLALLLVLSLLPIIITTINLIGKKNYNMLFVIAFLMIVAKFIYTIYIILRMPNLMAYLKVDALGLSLEIMSDCQFLFLIIGLIFAKHYKAAFLKFGSFFAGVTAVVSIGLFIKNNYAFILSGELNIMQAGIRFLEPLSSLFIAIVMIYIFFYIYIGEKLYFGGLKYLIMVPSVIWVLQNVYNSVFNIQFVMPNVIITFVICAGLFVLANMKRNFSSVFKGKDSKHLKVSENAPG